MAKPYVILLSAVFLLSGCIHTTVTQREVSAAKGPYQKILVCSLSDDAARAVLIEEALSKRLAKHRVATQTCSSFMAGPPTSDTLTIGRIHKEGFDALLVVQRDTVAHETPPPGSLITKSTVTSLEGFLNAFDAMSAPPTDHSAGAPGTVESSLFGKERLISGTVKLIGVQEDRLAWAGGGTVEGPVHKPLESFIDSMADQTEHDLSEAGMIPPK
jgi:hypothetical protein